MEPAPEIDAQLRRRREAAVAAWGLSDELVVIGAGSPISIPGRADLTYPYRAHSEYFYLTDRNAPGGVLAFDPHDGWTDFVVPVTEEDRLWSGAPAGQPEGVAVTEFPAWLAARTGRPLAALGVAPTDRGVDAELTEVLSLTLGEVRRPKDAVELERMRVAERSTRAAFFAVRELLTDGITERRVQIELEAAAYRHGADAMAYDTIVGSGPNSAVLHFPPSARVLRQGDLVLVDAGGEYRGYASDVTRTYPVSGRLGPEQAELHEIVRAAELAAIERCRAGVEWRDVHHVAAGVIAEGLIGAGILRGRPDSLMESGAVRLFFPHGVGHPFGLGVRDAGGILVSRRGRPSPVPHLRADLPLRAGMTMTVEPGIYFVPALLEDADRRAHHRDEVDWALVDRRRSFGGIRIEDNVIVGEDGCELLTDDIPLL